MTARLLAAAAICTAAPLFAMSPTAHAASATVVGEAACLYAGPSWMSSWSVTSAYPYSVYGAGLERTHQFDESSATLEVLVNVGSATEPRLELVSTTITRPEGCDGTTPAPIPAPDPAVEVEPVGAREPIAASATVVGEASCLYGGPSWMSSWSVTSSYPFSVYGAGLQRTHQFDEDSAMLEVLVNVGSATAPQFELVSTTISRPDGCDGIIPPVELVVDAEPIVVDPVVESEPPAEQADALPEPEPEVELADDSAPVAGPESLRASDDDDDADRRDDRRNGRWHRALHRSANLDDDDRRDRRNSFDREDRDDRKDRSAFRLRHRLDLRD